MPTAVCADASLKNPKIRVAAKIGIIFGLDDSLWVIGQTIIERSAVLSMAKNKLSGRSGRGLP
jgi:hypothetical protein